MIRVIVKDNESSSVKDKYSRFSSLFGVDASTMLFFLQEIENESSLDTKSSKEKKVAILFTDIVGFTKLSENMEPNQVLELLSKYQTKMVDAIFANGGTVDKFIGDSVMATFGTPVSRGNDAQHALNCAKNYICAIPCPYYESCERI